MCNTNFSFKQVGVKSVKTAKYHFLIILGLLFLWPVGKSTAQEPPGKPFQSLFNGLDLEGWSVKRKKADSSKKYFTVDNGAILIDADKDHEYMWLYSDQEYKDFILLIKFQVQEERTSGNSGVQIRSRYDVNESGGWLNGPQVDINYMEPFRTGYIYDETLEYKRWIHPEAPSHIFPKDTFTSSDAPFFLSHEGADSIQIRYAIGATWPAHPDDGMLLQTVPVSDTAFSFSGLPAGKAYRFSSFVKDLAGNWSLPPRALFEHKGPQSIHLNNNQLMDGNLLQAVLLKIYSLDGKLLYSLRPPFSATTMSPGLYIMKFHTGKGFFTSKTAIF